MLTEEATEHLTCPLETFAIFDRFLDDFGQQLIRYLNLATNERQRVLAEVETIRVGVGIDSAAGVFIGQKIEAGLR